MAVTGSSSVVNQQDIEQVQIQAQQRWLYPAEICEILRNYTKFRISSEPPNMPPSGSLFLFDRKVLKYFRKDGHIWRKKKNRKKIEETHEKLKVGSIAVLHCYYAHGEENEKFQRRIYWILEAELSHIVLVHYLEEKGYKRNYNRIKATEENTPNSQEIEESVPNTEIEGYMLPSQTTDTTSLNSAQPSEYVVAEPVHINQASFGFHSSIDPQQSAMEKMDVFTNDYEGKFSVAPGTDFSSPAEADKSKDGNDAVLADESWENLEIQSLDSSGVKNLPVHPSSTSNQPDTAGNIPIQGHEMLGQLFTNNFGEEHEFESHLDIQDWQTSENDSSPLPKWALDQKLYSDSAHNITSRSYDQDNNHADLLNLHEPSWINSDKQNDHQILGSKIERGYLLKSESESNTAVEGKSTLSSAIKEHYGSLTEEALENCQNIDSFNRWMSQELGDLQELRTNSSSGAYWETVCTENGLENSIVPPQVHLDSYVLGPSLSQDQDQFYSIIHFSPNWAYVKSEVEVLIYGRFQMNQQEAEKCKWSCMFGEVEVPAEIIADGVLRCLTPPQKVGTVPFYVTCSNRLACSQVREFEYRANHVPDVGAVDSSGELTSESLRRRFVKLLCLSSVGTPNYNPNNLSDISQMSMKISSLLKDEIEEWYKMLELTEEEKFSAEEFQEKPLHKLLKDLLAALRNAAQAAASIHQVYHVQSFQNKQLKKDGSDTFGMLDERSVSLVAVKTHKQGHHDEPVHAAAIRIQNKLRSWKGRKDFLIIRQQIVKIQAHVRGHQVRKNYRKIIWSGGILEKSEALTEGSSMLDTSSKEDDYDFLKEGRKQEQEAEAMVKSMVQYPEGRIRYRQMVVGSGKKVESKSKRQRPR